MRRLKVLTGHYRGLAEGRKVFVGDGLTCY